MARTSHQAERAEQFILQSIAAGKSGVAAMVAAKFGVTRQTANNYINRLTERGLIQGAGNTQSRQYTLLPLEQWAETFKLANGPSESDVWLKSIQPKLEGLPKNVVSIWHFAFTEMYNNAIDHSNGTSVTVSLNRTAADVKLDLLDNGIGIFKKIQKAMALDDERHAVLELSKGKFTTDPKNHSGQGIFFTSRMLDRFAIFSDDVHYDHKATTDEDWIAEGIGIGGTGVLMSLSNFTTLTSRAVFDRFTEGDELAFNKTVVPVRIAQYGDDALVSRSQAKRLLTRFDRFRVVVLDFSGVESIGQAFADEVFRVFPLHHPKVEIHAIHANKMVTAMITRAKNSETQ